MISLHPLSFWREQSAARVNSVAEPASALTVDGVAIESLIAPIEATKPIAVILKDFVLPFN